MIIIDIDRVLSFDEPKHRAHSPQLVVAKRKMGTRPEDGVFERSEEKSRYRGFRELQLTFSKEAVEPTVDVKTAVNR